VVVGVYVEMILMLKIMLLLLLLLLLSSSSSSSLLLELSGGGAILEQGLHLHFHNYHYSLQHYTGHFNNHFISPLTSYCCTEFTRHDTTSLLRHFVLKTDHFSSHVVDLEDGEHIRICTSHSSTLTLCLTNTLVTVSLTNLCELNLSLKNCKTW